MIKPSKNYTIQKGRIVMLDYRSLGLVNTREMLRRAYEGGYAVPALYFISAEQVNAIFDAAGEEGSPVILLALSLIHI